MTPQLDIVQNRHPLEELDILKRARNAQFSNMVRGQPGDIFAFEMDFTFMRRIEAADTV